MRRVISIVLLLVFVLPGVTPLLAMTRNAESKLPACCRKDGKHHCGWMASQSGTPLPDGNWFQAPVERCPYAPAALGVSHSQALGTPASCTLCDASLCATPAALEGESAHRMTRVCSHQKRGPPSLLI